MANKTGRNDAERCNRSIRFSEPVKKLGDALKKAANPGLRKKGDHSDKLSEGAEALETGCKKERTYV